MKRDYLSDIFEVSKDNLEEVIMKKVNKFLSVMLSLIMIISIIPMSTITANAAVQTGTCGDNLTWAFDESTGTLTISGTGEMYNYSLVYNETPFFSPWYELPITNVLIQDNVTTIGDFAFAFCYSLRDVTIPNNITSIGDFAFAYCNNLTSSIIIPDSVTSIGSGAFGFCSNISKVHIGKNVQHFGSPFVGCANLTDIVIDSKNPYIILEDGIIYSKDKTKIVEYLGSNLAETFVIPEYVTSIGFGSFSYNTHLLTVVIPTGIKLIDDYTFEGCSNLTNKFVIYS